MTRYTHKGCTIYEDDLPIAVAGTTETARRICQALTVTTVARGMRDGTRIDTPRTDLSLVPQTTAGDIL